MQNPFKQYHPLVAFLYLASALVFSMLALQPGYLALSFAGALVCLALVDGVHAAFRSLVWVAPLSLFLALVNTLVVTTGETVLCWLGARPVTFEALCFGLCSGVMLSAVLLWFKSYAVCVDGDASLALFGRFLPTVNLMISQTIRLFSQFIKRGREVAAVQSATHKAVSEENSPNISRKTKGSLRIVSVLMGWGMEDGLIRSASMKARGYGATKCRTTYIRYHLGAADKVVLGVLVVLVVVNGFLLAIGGGTFEFYPTLSGFAPWQNMVAYAALLMVPAALKAREAWVWRT